MNLSDRIDRTHLVGQLHAILQTMIYLQEQQKKVQKQIDKLKQKEDIMKEDVKAQILKMKDEDLFLITYYAKKYREIITRKGKFDNKCRDWTTPKGSYCFCYFDMDAETVNPYRTATNPIRIERIDV